LFSLAIQPGRKLVGHDMSAFRTTRIHTGKLEEESQLSETYRLNLSYAVT